MVFGWRDVKYIMVENRFTRRWYVGGEPMWNIHGGRRAIALLQEKGPFGFVKWGGVLHFCMLPCIFRPLSFTFCRGK